ncbi:ABC transporter permease subunit [Micromonospora sp. HM5-17]|jgi:ABC-type transport system involved in multi-copper enzyme maturation permease subunit|uniref:ABC transporter permease subunit n=1 Tax=Micromonospora sp. HM5-17 TaxID=2487710 RepID=UPI000F47E2F7|nr:ABC transporter permease subunit [Micromonospora sp. HM5-17]ROT29697.1 ABC transporter permease [Micromonospora sp. HM5-17]
MNGATSGERAPSGPVARSGPARTVAATGPVSRTVGNPLRAVVAAELTKLGTLRSTYWTLAAAFVVTVGLTALIALSFRTSLPHQPPQRQADFDPLFATFYGVTLGQLAMVVFGVLAVGVEYRSGSIRASLLAVPHRGRWYVGKVLAAAVPSAVAAVATVLTTLVVAQVVLGPYAVPTGADGLSAALVGAGLHLTLLTLFALGVAALLRSAVWSLSALLPVFLLGSQGLGNVPGLRTVTQYLPDQTTWVIMHLAGPQDDPRWAREYGPWTGVGILVLWTVAALVGGYLVLRRRDA